MTEIMTLQPAEQLIVAQAIQQAVSCHKAGQLQEAENLYRAVLKIQPHDPDANHNLGVLSVQAEQPLAGLPYFKAALEIDPTSAQFWLSYINALMLAGQTDTARGVLAHARQQGLEGAAVDTLLAQLNVEGAGTVVSPAATSSSVQHAKKTKPHKSSKKRGSDTAEPSQQEINALITLFDTEHYVEGEASARAMTLRFPQHGFGWKVLGAMLKLQGRSSEALVAMQKAAELLPRDEQAQNNLGTVLSDLQRWSEAEDFHRRAVRIKPDFAEALFNLSNALQAQNKLADAEAGFQQALHCKPDFAEAHFNLGNLFKMQGKLAAAEGSYRRAVGFNSEYYAAHNNLGVTLAEQGLLLDAAASYRRALELRPDQAATHNNLANTLKDLGQFSEAEISYRQALALKPDVPETHNNLGNAFKEQGRALEAEASYRHALALKPDYAEAYNNLGIVLKAQQRILEAEESYRQALQLKPDFVEAFYNLGISLTEQARFAEGETYYRKALEIRPEYVEARNNLGNNLEQQGRFTEAEAVYLEALKIKPDYSDAHCNLGNVLREQGRVAEAEVSYRRAIEIKSDFAEALFNLGIVLTEQDKLLEGEGCYRQALQIKPHYKEAHRNLGVVIKEQGRFSEAAASYHHALKLDPDYVEARGNLLFDTNYTASQPPAYCLEEARQYGQMLDRKVSKSVLERFTAWSCTQQPTRLRVGLVSGDLQNHPVGYFLESLLTKLDAARVEIIAYPTHHNNDEVTTRIRNYCSAWKPLFGQSDESAARLINSDGIHILFDLSGHTAKNRLPMFAWKPAPVQVSWLGYFATTGVTQVDYLLGDPYVTPTAEESHFTETVWRLPETYLCFTPPNVALDVGPLPALSTGGITFGCFNNLTKMNDAVVALWSRVLVAVPGSKLLLKTKQLTYPAAGNQTRERFAAFGISADRLIIEGKAPRAELLAAYNRIDIALDPFPYPGGTTSVEGLWMGVPVITRRGDRFISHVGESIAHSVGLTEWIAADDDDYVAKAVAYANNIERLATLRAGLRQQVLASPLFDATRFANHFETALWEMWQRWQAQQGISQ